jgi:hypothetical protein
MNQPLLDKESISPPTGFSGRALIAEFSVPSKSDRTSLLKTSHTRFKNHKNVEDARYIKKNLKLKHLSRNLILKCPEAPMLRILDMMFGLDFTNSLPNSPDQPKSSEYEIYRNLLSIKRVVKITHTADKDEYFYSVIERWPTKQVWKGWQNIKKFNSLLREYNTQKTQNLAANIEKYTNYIRKIEKDLDIGSFGDDFTIGTQSEYEPVKLDESVRQEILKLPYLCLKERILCKDCKGNMVGFFHNRKFAELVGITPRMGGELEGFEPLNSVKTDCWVEFYSTLFDFMEDAKSFHRKTRPGLISIYNAQNKAITGVEIFLLKNQTLVEDNIINDLYIVLKKNPH